MNKITSKLPKEWWKNWPEKWQDAPLAVFDVETTGLEAQKDRVIEIGIVHFQAGKWQKDHNWLINPGFSIDNEITEITGISNDDLADKPSFDDIAAEVLKAFEERILVAYNFPFDRGMLAAEFARIQGENDDNLWPKAGTLALDPLIYAHALYPKLKNRKLAMIASHLEVNLENAHRASHDAKATGEVLYKMADRLPESLLDLITLQSQWHADQEAKWAQRKRKKAGLNFNTTQKNDSVFSSNDTLESHQSLGPSFVYGSQTDPVLAYYSTIRDARD